jgi:phage tail tape-measure protein
VRDAHARLNEYARLLSELNDHYDEDLDRVMVFPYSEELVRAMNEHEAYSPDDAWIAFADRIDELLSELAVGGTK